MGVTLLGSLLGSEPPNKKLVGPEGVAFLAGRRFLGAGGVPGGTASSGSGLFGLRELGFLKSLERGAEGHMPLAEGGVSFGRNEGRRGKWTRNSSLNQRFDELSINKSETHGFHFL